MIWSFEVCLTSSRIGTWPYGDKPLAFNILFHAARQTGVWTYR